jgi:hypothetical protein
MPDENDRLIYHVFADDGVESEALSAHGKVVRIGLDPFDTNASQPVKADAEHFPLKPGADLIFLQPPCYQWATATRNARDKKGMEYPDMIPLARELGKKYGAHYVIENVPEAPLRDAVTLNGDMFGLPIKMPRAFETSFHVEQPVRERKLTETRHWYDEYGDLSRDWWKAVKGVRNDYRKDPLVKSGIPRPYLRHLLTAWIDAEDELPSYPERVADETEQSTLAD